MAEDLREDPGEFYPGGTVVPGVPVVPNIPVVPGGGGGASIAEILIETTYAELVELRNRCKLVPGMRYRITDYVATTTQEDTKSADHPFDIIVTADNEYTINETASAIRHYGDQYFPDNTKFEAWQIWYSLDNDITRFYWADHENGKGVIYRMIDEFGNDVPWDFKGILLAAYRISYDHPDYIYTFGDYDDSSTFDYYERCRNNTIRSFDKIICWNFICDGGCNNELGADCCENEIWGSNNKLGDGCYCNRISGSFNKLGVSCSYNLIYGENNKLGSNCYDNALEESYDCVLGDYCESNQLECGSSNILHESCVSNYLSWGSYNNTLHRGCYNNTIGSDWFEASGVVLGDDCGDCYIGGGCSDITLGANVFYMNLPDFCRSITVQGGVFDVIVECAQDRGDWCYYQNVEFKSGLMGVTIYDPAVDQEYHTEYRAKDSVAVMVDNYNYNSCE